MKPVFVVLIGCFLTNLSLAQKGQSPAPQLPSTDPSRNVFGMPQVTATTLTGKVMMEDGTAPPGPVVIQRFCADGTVVSETVTDQKGRFSADLSARYHEGVSGRASQLNPLAGCKIRGVLGGYSSDEIDLAKSKLASGNDVGKMVLHKREGSAGVAVSETTQGAPKDARKSYDKGRELLLQKGRLDDAQKSFEKAVALYPQFAAAWNELGTLYAQKGMPAEARNAYRSAIGADARFVPPIDGLAFVSAQESKWDEVTQLTGDVIRLDPVDYPRSYFLNGMAKYRARDFDGAEKSTREAIKVDGLHEFPQAQFQLALILIMKRDNAAAAEQLRAYIAAYPKGGDVPAAQKELAALDEELKKAKK
jgi:Tfp pilus assembly protein PilF